jgi:hypothetical protein
MMIMNTMTAMMPVKYPPIRASASLSSRLT